MKKSILLLTTITLVGLMALQTGCTHEGICRRANGAIEVDTLSLNAFTGIYLQENADVYVKQGTQQEIVVSAESDVMDELDFRVDNGNLIIDVNACFYNKELEVFITVPSTQALAELVVSGSGDLMLEDSLVLADELVARVSGSGSLVGAGANAISSAAISISGSGKAELDLEATDIESKISGSGKAFLYGTSANFSGTVSGSGDIRAFDLMSQNVDIRISGSGDAEVFVDGGTLTARISGSGNVQYKGTPSSTDTRVTGSGSVQDAN